MREREGEIERGREGGREEREKAIIKDKVE